jgi:hypothetical protein
VLTITKWSPRQQAIVKKGNLGLFCLRGRTSNGPTQFFTRGNAPYSYLTSLITCQKAPSASSRLHGGKAGRIEGEAERGIPLITRIFYPLLPNHSAGQSSSLSSSGGLSFRPVKTPPPTDLLAHHTESSSSLPVPAQLPSSLQL